MHGLDGVEILVYNTFKAAAPVAYIPDDAAQDAHICIGVHVNLDVHLAAQFPALEDEYTLNDDDLCWLYGDSLVGAEILG